MSTYKTTMQIDSGEGDEDVPVVVQYNAVPFSAGSTDGRHGPKIEPDEPAHIDIESVTLPDGRDYELSKDERSSLEDEINCWLQGAYDQDPPEGYHDGPTMSITTYT